MGQGSKEERKREDRPDLSHGLGAGALGGGRRGSRRGPPQEKVLLSVPGERKEIFQARGRGGPSWVMRGEAAAMMDLQALCDDGCDSLFLGRRGRFVWRRDR